MTTPHPVTLVRKPDRPLRSFATNGNHMRVSYSLTLDFYLSGRSHHRSTSEVSSAWGTINTKRVKQGRGSIWPRETPHRTKLDRLKRMMSQNCGFGTRLMYSMSKLHWDGGKAEHETLDDLSCIVHSLLKNRISSIDHENTAFEPTKSPIAEIRNRPMCTPLPPLPICAPAALRLVLADAAAG